MEETDILFHYVLVINIENDNGKAKPYIKYRFPPQEDLKDKKKDSLSETIAQFCFPEEEQWVNSSFLKQKKKAPSETFNFVLTELDGTRKFGYCRRFTVENKGEIIPECYCILSLLPSASVFYEVLNVIEELRKRSSTAVFSFLKSVLAKSFPNPGETLTIKTFEGDTFNIKRSDNDFLLDMVTNLLRMLVTLLEVSFTTLFKNTKVKTILDVFAALLAESRVIICAKEVSTLSSCVNAFTGLIYPFTWQHVFIPILPKALVTYCCAPMPFLVGILTANLSELNKYPMEEVVLLDVDSGKYLRDVPANCNFKKILPAAAEALKTELESILSSGHGNRAKDLSISQALLNFMYTIFGNYTNFMKNHQFNREEFKNSKTVDNRKFLDYFGETQMYEMFIKSREAMSRNGRLNHCVLSKSKFVAMTTKTSENLGKEKEGGVRMCCKCKKEGDISEFVEKKGALYCKPCFEKKKQKTKGKFRSMISIPQISISSPSSDGKSAGSNESGEDSKMNKFIAKASHRASSTLLAAKQLAQKTKESLDEVVTGRPRDADSHSQSARDLVRPRNSTAADLYTPPPKEPLRPRGSTDADLYPSPRHLERSPPKAKSLTSLNPSPKRISPVPESKPTGVSFRTNVQPIQRPKPDSPIRRPTISGTKQESNNLMKKQELRKEYYSVQSGALHTTTTHTPERRATTSDKRGGAVTPKPTSRPPLPPSPPKTPLPPSQAALLPDLFCGYCGSGLQNGVCTNCTNGASQSSEPTPPSSSSNDVCVQCNQEFDEYHPYVIFCGKRFHSRCLFCAKCGDRFTDLRLTMRKGQAYHEECAPAAS